MSQFRITASREDRITMQATITVEASTIKAARRKALAYLRDEDHGDCEFSEVDSANGRQMIDAIEELPPKPTPAQMELFTPGNPA